VVQPALTLLLSLTHGWKQPNKLPSRVAKMTLVENLLEVLSWTGLKLTGLSLLRY
jgi:hypothetical protein